MADSPLKIQLAIQGGGAKIAALLATLEAVNELQKEGEITVTRIAGTSAGAIVGCLYAAGDNVIQLARIRLSNIKPPDIERTFPQPWPLGIFSPGSVKRAHMLYRLAKGNPLWATTFVEKILAEVLQEAGGFETVNELNRARGIKVKIIAADLTNSGKVVHEGDEPLMTALMDSCGIPFCFRTWSKGGSRVIVDGGICENLPSEELDSPQDIDEFGRVVGISFKKPSPKRVHDPLSFSTALLDTAMQNSMERARSRLGAGSVFSIETKLDTFDFVDAVVNGLDVAAAYGFVKGRAKEWFKGFIDRQKRSKQVIVGDPWSTQGIPLMERLGRVYDAQHKSTKFTYGHCSVAVQARIPVKQKSSRPRKTRLSSLQS